MFKVLILFFVMAVFSSSGTIQWIKDLWKNIVARDFKKIRDSLMSFAFALVFAPIIQLSVTFVFSFEYGINHIPQWLILFWFLFFLAAQQYFYEWIVQIIDVIKTTLKDLLPKIINFVLKKFGLLKEENNGADTANTNGND
jgi:hypothetical protein